MIRRTAPSGFALSGLLALAVVLFACGAAKAENVYIKNDTEMTIVVEMSTVIGGKVVRDRPVLIAPGKTAAFSVPGNKVVQVQDAKVLRPLFNGTIPASKDDQAYSLQMGTPTKAKLEKK